MGTVCGLCLSWHPRCAGRHSRPVALYHHPTWCVRFPLIANGTFLFPVRDKVLCLTVIYRGDGALWVASLFARILIPFFGMLSRGEEIRTPWLLAHVV